MEPPVAVSGPLLAIIAAETATAGSLCGDLADTGGVLNFGCIEKPVVATLMTAPSFPQPRSLGASLTHSLSSLLLINAARVTSFTNATSFTHLGDVSPRIAHSYAMNSRLTTSVFMQPLRHSSPLKSQGIDRSSTINPRSRLHDVATLRTTASLPHPWGPYPTGSIVHPLFSLPIQVAQVATLTTTPSLPHPEVSGIARSSVTPTNRYDVAPLTMLRLSLTPEVSGDRSLLHSLPIDVARFHRSFAGSLDLHRVVHYGGTLQPPSIP
ncbi:hypothetical protein BDK51DRAFT_44890 [Blyttiomyces helicus]|uniref:Uncharacterized protein n=1 Tax=Blyttiomyces helicus TaxID=388810 RepID=A0A4V1IRY0_9FUNG|nr:hypothetical protein BDK51DRAFT_44890 [Blyttiomyces helicus]|eukprot:RKO91627.1 hypothetical protein BDK51DRAFT_44890 [Blyttiomyces helicus]